MNHIYRSMWSEALKTWIAVSEHTKGKSKNTSKREKKVARFFKGWQLSSIVMTGLLMCSANSWALPTGNQLIAGQATISTPNVGQMQINQASQKAVINWQGFSVAPTEAVNIQQPNTQAALLNRVVGQDASQIQGKLNANGQVYLVNPNGVVFSNTAQVDVGGLIASTHNITNQDFINSNQHFTQNGSTGKVENHGTINAKDGGVVALIGEHVTNTGTINTPKGTSALAAGKTVDLDFQGDGLVEIKVTEAALNAQINNQGVIQADGGRVVMTTKAAGQLIDTVINQEGVVKARGLVERNGEIILEGGYIAQTGILNVSGTTGGKVAINARTILDAGQTKADGIASNGGIITMKASDAIIQTAAADTHANGTTTGGTVHLEATNSVFSSGKLSAKGIEQGGTVDVLSNNRVVLAAAEVDASGTTRGGLVRVGGDFHGTNPTVANANTTIVNGASKIKANGSKGKVVIWSNEKTDYYGSISADKQGDIEVSSKGNLTYAGIADAGVGGNLLLDPKNIFITNKGSVASYELIDPHKAAYNFFGDKTALLGTTVNGVFTENGNIVVSSRGDDTANVDAGAVYLFDVTTGALKAMLTGSHSSDFVNMGITALTNGNYVVNLDHWNNSQGAATWGNGSTGISGVISDSNSLVGSNNRTDFVGRNITALSNGNYVVSSPFWHSALGAVTWGDGSTTGTRLVGTIDASNSLVGSNQHTSIGSSVTALNNGNYVVQSWNSGLGAVTWADGSSTGTRLVGTTIDASNSLVGSNTNDAVGSGGYYLGSNVIALTNGNYVVGSQYWNKGRGAATWGDGSATGTRLIGTINASNSLVGSNQGDAVGSTITPLTNGNYVVGSLNWNSNRGAATWGDGSTTGTRLIGTIDASNSLVGFNSFESVGSRITALTNGNYVVGSADWMGYLGSITWGNGSTTGTRLVGTINPNNSLLGYGVGSNIVALSNGNYVVGSPNWNNGSGAVTWGDGSTTGTRLIGVIDASNSLIGDSVGSRITALSNGNYVVRRWNNSLGAAIWGDGSTAGTRLTGTINANTGLVGSYANDSIGSSITALKNGNYVVVSPYWHNYMGALTWGDGSNTGTRLVGTVNSGNSLVGSHQYDLSGLVGQRFIPDPLNILPLNNGNYVVSSYAWDNGNLVDAGQVRVVTPQNISFDNGIGQIMTFNPSLISQTLALGTNVTLQANNDITLDTNSNILVSGNTGGKLTLQAGRNITLNSSITTANGDFTAIAGDKSANQADRDAGTPTLTLGHGVRINAGTGKVILSVEDGIFANYSGTPTPINASQWQIHYSSMTVDEPNNELSTLLANLEDQLVPLQVSTTATKKMPENNSRAEIVIEGLGINTGSKN